MAETTDPEPNLPQAGTEIDGADSARFWADDYVNDMHALLGSCVCRRLGIFSLPPGFRLSVIVPVYNEQQTVAKVVRRLRQTGLPLQIILVNDGSVDGTDAEINLFRNDDDVIVLHHETNRGKGSAIRTGINAAEGDVIVIQDADQEYDPTDFRYLLQPILFGEAEIAYGTRYGHYHRQLSPWWHQAVNGLLSMLASLAIGIRLSDVETCYKMARREHFQAIADQLREKRFGIEIELTARWARLGLTFTERPIHYSHRWYQEGKKIGWRDGISALWCILKYGLLGR